jgi:nitroimidazol reductase NimA-like FMN-containing flavoprotein (pyridoxamine 5'-phosphate oxidase superfamily)
MSRDYSLKNGLPTAHQRLPEYKRGQVWTRDFLRKAEIGYIGTQWGNQPFITPISFWFDEQNHRIVFHSNLSGRMRANLEHNPKACFVANQLGRYLPSNVALDFSLQYRSVMVFGKVHLLDEPGETRQALYGLLKEYFPKLEAGKQYRPITDQELKRTSVYALQIESWSGKENWKERADQSDEWAPLDEKWFRE